MIKKIQNLSVKWKLFFAYSSIVTVTVLIFSLIVLLCSETVVVNLAQRNVEQTITSSHKALVSKINNINACLLSFQTKKDVQSILCGNSTHSLPQEINILESELMDIDVFQNNISSFELYVLNRDDYPTRNNGNSVFSDTQMKNDPWFNAAIKQDNSTHWTVRSNIDEANNFILASKLIFDVTSNRPVAVLKANIDISNFTDVVSNVVLGKTGSMFVSSDSHLLNYSSSELGYALTNNSILFNDMLKKQENETREIVLNGENCIISTYPISDTGMFLIGVAKIKEFRSTQNAFFIAIFITMLVLLLLSVMFIRYTSAIITKPISELTDVMRNYNGDHPIPMKTNINNEIGVMSATFNEMQIKIIALLENIEKESLLRKRAELKALQAQITPHFLYNTLNSVCILAKRYNAADIQQIMVALSNFFTISLSNGAEIIRLEQELEHINNYVYIQKIRYADKFSMRTDIPDDLMNTLICKLTLQPLVENCINHAFSEMDELGIIEIAAHRENDTVIITVSDNGRNDAIDIDELNRYVTKDFEPDESIEKYGIHNVNQRLQLYFGEEYGLSYRKNEPHGLTAVIKIKSNNEVEV